jgi:hypothetical protein
VRAGRESDARASPARRIGRAGALGALLAALVFAFVVSDGGRTLLTRAPTATDFYDVQAESFLEGRWDVPRKPLAIEGFLVDGKVYEYFGPMPALLRMPVVAITDDLDGRLGGLSMLLGFGVAMLFTVRLLIRVRPLVRDDAPVSTLEVWAVGIFTFVAGAGSTILFLASRTWVFHEAAVWGVAWALGAFELIIAVTQRPSVRNLTLAGLFTALALLSRASVGLGPLLALGLVGVAFLWSRTRRLVGGPDHVDLRKVMPVLAAGVVVPVALYAYVNTSKFGTPFSVPFEQQFLAKLSANHRAALDANGGGMFGLQYVPTTFASYFGAGGLRPSALLPWVEFSGQGGVIGDAVFAFRLPTASVQATMPFLTVLGIVGLVGMVLGHRLRAAGLAVLRAPVVGAVVAGISTLAFAYVAQRYLADFVPILVVLAIAGLHVTVRAAASRQRRRGRVVFVAATFTVLAVLSVWGNLGLAVLYQDRLEPGVTDHRFADFMRLQYEVHEVLPGGAAPEVRRRHTLSLRDPKVGDVVVIGNCIGAYGYDGDRWVALDRSPAAGERHLRVRFPEQTKGWEPLVMGVAPDGGPLGVVARVSPGRKLQFGLNGVFESEPRVIDTDRVHDVAIVLDPYSGEYRVTVDGTIRQVMDTPNRYYSRRLPRLHTVTIGRNRVLASVAPRFSGRVRDVTRPSSFCEDALAR